MSKNQTDCAKLVTKFSKWMQHHTEIKSLSSETCKITLPFKDPSNDLISIFIRKLEDGNFKLTDLGNAYGYLFLHATNPRSERMKNLQSQLERKLGIIKVGEEIQIKTKDPVQINEAILNLVQAIFEIKQHRILSRMSIKDISDFDRKVEATFDEWDLEYEKKYNFKGASGKDYEIDYKIPTNGIPFSSFVDILSTYGKGSARYQLSIQVEKVLDFRQVYDDKSKNVYIIILDDREENADIWNKEKITFVRFAGSIPLFWKRDNEILEKILVEGNEKIVLDQFT